MNTFNNKSEAIIKLINEVTPADFAKSLATRYSRGQGYHVTVGQIEAEARLNADPAVRAEILVWLEGVYETEAAEADISRDTAKYLLLRGHAASRLLQARGASIYQCLKGGRTPFVAVKELLLVLAICQDDGPGEFPTNDAEARELVSGSYGLSQPGYVRAVKAYLEDKCSLAVAKRAHGESVKAWLDTATDRAWIAEQLQVILNDVVDAAKLGCPQDFVGGDLLGSFVGHWAPEALALLDVETTKAGA